MSLRQLQTRAAELGLAVKTENRNNERCLVVYDPELPRSVAVVSPNAADDDAAAERLLLHKDLR